MTLIIRKCMLPKIQCAVVQKKKNILPIKVSLFTTPYLLFVSVFICQSDIYPFFIPFDDLVAASIIIKWCVQTNHLMLRCVVREGWLRNVYVAVKYLAVFPLQQYYYVRFTINWILLDWLLLFSLLKYYFHSHSLKEFLNIVLISLEFSVHYFFFNRLSWDFLQIKDEETVKFDISF